MGLSIRRTTGDARIVIAPGPFLGGGVRVLLGREHPQPGLAGDNTKIVSRRYKGREARALRRGCRRFPDAGFT